jgi:hypothetical protein
MISRDEAFAQGFRLAWRWCPIAAAVAVGSFLAIAALGYFWEQVEIANAIQRTAQ